MNRVRPRAATALAIALAAVSGTVTAATAADTGGIRADIRADVNRDGAVDVTGDSDAAGKTTWNSGRGAIFLPNIGDKQRRCKTRTPDVACFATACSSTSGPDPAAPSTTSSAAGASSASEERNKALVLRLYSEVFNKNKTDVVKELVGTDYVQHDKSVPGGAAGQVKQFKDVKAKIPGAVATVKRVAADRDLVAVHWHASATPANEATGEAKIDLYRVSNGKLVEHWGITQTVPAKTASGNSLFSDEYRYPKEAPTLSEELEEKNRKFAVTAYRKLSDGDATVIDKSWDPRYYQHNPLIANGTDPLKQFLQQDTQGDSSPSSAPDGSTPPTGGGGTRFGNTLADGDLVWVFSSDYVVADIFRVVDGKIIEHWDVVADGQ